MTWRDVARRDLRSVYRSRSGVGIALALLLSTAGVSLAILALSSSPPTTTAATVVVGSVLSLVVPLVALVGSYGALVGERTAGSVRFLVGLPNSRADAYLGKYVSRSLVVLVPLLVGTLLSGVVVAAFYDDGSLVGVLVLGVAAVPYALAFLGLGLTFSALTSTDTSAGAAAIGAFVVLRAGWPAAQFAAISRLEDPYPYPEWYFEFGRLSPINAYVHLTTMVGDVEFHPLLSRPDPSVTTVATTYEFAAVVLAVWAVLTPIAGFLYWRRRDLL